MAGKTTEQKRAILKRLATVPPKDDSHLHWWFKTYLGFDIPRVQVCEHHVAPFTAIADSYFARHPIIFWEGSRGFSGKSISLSALALCEAITQGANIRLLGGSGEQAQRVNAYISGEDPNAKGMFWDAPLAPKSLLASTTKSEVRTTNGGYIKALMASSTSIRGSHPSKLRIDEVDEMELNLYDSAMGQTMSRGDVKAQTTVSSTHQHPDGTFTELKRRAREQGFPIYQWCVAPETMVSTPDGRKRIDEVREGDTVYGHDGSGIRMATVKWCGATRTSRTYDILLSNGRTLRCSPEHLLLTEKGWLSAEEIVSGDRLVSELRQGAALAFNGAGERDGVVSGLRSTLQAGTPESLRRMRCSDTEEVEALLGLPSKEDDDTQQDECCLIGRGPGAEILAQSYIQVGEGSSGTSMGSGNLLESACAHGSVSDGSSCESPTQSSHRCAQPVSPQSARGAREGRAQASCRGGEWVRVPDSMGRRDAHVVEGVAGLVTVVGVFPGPELELWDMTVPGLDSFVAEGVVVHNCWRETLQPHGWLHPDEVERKRREVPEAMFRSEYDLLEPVPEGRIFSDETIDLLFDKSLGVFEGRPGEECVVVPASSDHQYFTGADFARREDMSVFHTMMRSKTGPDILAAWTQINRIPWPVIISKYNARLHEYSGASMHDSTGVGDVVSDYLTADSEGFNFSRQKEAMEMFSSFIASVEAGEQVFPLIQPLYDAMKYATVDDVFGPGHVPDPFIAAALAWRAREWATFTLQLARL